MSAARLMIVEDEFIIAESMRSMLTEMGHEVVGHAFDGREALDLAAQHVVDLALLDITLGGGMDGIALGERLKLEHQIPCLFLTSHSDQATVVRASSIKPLGYLLKPFDKHSLYASVAVALSNLPEPQTVIVKVGNTHRRVALGDIHYLKADRVYIEVYHQHGMPLLVREPLSALEPRLSSGFMRVHRSYIVNLAHVEQLSTSEVVVAGHRIPITRQMREEIVRRM